MKPTENIWIMTGVALAVQLANVSTVSAAAAEELLIEEVIVTAQRREQNLQDVPLSVSAISGDSLRDGGVLDISRLKLLVPGMNFGQTGAYAHVAIRGARTEAIQVNTQPIISNYIDGIYRSGTEQFLGPMVDLDRVEVLRGPQGTLFGRNSYGGAIALYTNKPTQEFDASLKFTGGNYNRTDYEGMINVPLSDTISARIVGAHFEHDGYVENNFPGGDDIDDQDADYIRGSLLFEFDNASLIVRGEYYEQGGAGSGDFAGSLAGSLLGGDVFEVPQPFNTLSGCGSYYNADPSLLVPPGATSYFDGQCPVPDARDPYEIATNAPYFLEAEQKTFSIEFNTDREWGSMRALAAYTENDNFRGSDGDQGIGTAYISGEIVTRETTQIEGHIVDNGEGDTSWLVGAFYLKENNHDNFFFNTDSRDTTGAQFPFTCTTSRDVDTTSFAVFGQVTFPVTDTTRVTVGARYSHEANDWRINDEFLYSFSVPVPVDIRDINIKTGEFAIVGPDVKVDETYTPITWRLAVDHDLSEDAMVYASVATGYSSGGFNSRTNPETGSFTFDESETIAYEVGYKATLMDGAMTLNIAAYYNDFKDFIAERSTVLPSLSVIVFGSLGGSAESMGVDLELDWIPSENWLVNLRASIMDSEFDSFTTSLGGSLTTAGPLVAAGGQLQFITAVQTPDYNAGDQIPVVQLKGEQIAYSPDFTLGLTVSYTMDLAGAGTLTPLLQWYRSDNYQASDQGYKHGEQDGYSQTTLRLTWSSADGNFHISGFVYNLEDEEVVTRANIFGATIATQQYAPPRTYGVTVSYTMGNN